MSDKTLAQRLEAHAQMHAELAASTGDTEQSGFAADLREAIAELAERDALAAERDALIDAVADKIPAQTMLTELAVRDGGIYAGIEGGAAGLLVAGFGEMLDSHPEATNYIEMSFSIKGKPVVVTVQKADKPTAHTLRKQAEGERDALRADAERYRLVRRGQHWSVINWLGDPLRAEVLDSAVDAARGAA